MRQTIAWVATVLFLLTAACSGGEKSSEFDKVTRLRCTGCHGPSQWKGKSFTAKGWQMIVDQMVERGAKLTDEEYRIVVEGWKSN